MVLAYDRNNPLIRFGIEQLKRAMDQQGTDYLDLAVRHGAPVCSGPAVVVGVDPSGSDDKESFTIVRCGETVSITGSGACGAMYGLFEYAERIASGEAMAEGEPFTRKPFLSMRGIKFNLPYIPFQDGEPFVQNEETCMDPGFWTRYIDMLALNRYNCLSLWSENPFHLFTVCDKYRAASPFDDVAMAKNIGLLRGIIDQCSDRGIKVYLFTWNIRITPEIAKGLGLPEIVGHFPPIGHRTDFQLNYFRRNSELIKDYYYQMVVHTLLLYPRLAGIGVSASEWMDGNGFEREAWIVDTYVRAIKDVGSKIRFIHRTNMQQAGMEIRGVQEMFAKDDFAISWKYSMAHCYSHPRPQFESLWNAWDGVEPGSVNILYTVRNDDVMTLRWYDRDYVRQYVEGMKRPNVEGFYWGSDGYLWGKDYQHVDHGHKAWDYDFERIEAQFQLWGRLSYDPGTPEERFIQLAAKTYTRKHAGAFLQALTAASKIIPAVNRLFWINYDYQWHPESCLSAFGFKTILDFCDGKAMPGVGVMGIGEYASLEHDGNTAVLPEGIVETPPDIIGLLRKSAAETREMADRLAVDARDDRYAQVECTLQDLLLWARIGAYYADKIEAALELCRYRLDRRAEHKSVAVELLKDAAGNWNELAAIWSRHYKPYEMARVHMTFGYTYYIEDVSRDIALAESID